MAKRKKTIMAGCIVKTILYTAPEPRDGERARAEKSRMTAAAQKAMNKQGRMTIHNVGETIMEVFEITGFVAILTIV